MKRMRLDVFKLIQTNSLAMKSQAEYLSLVQTYFQRKTPYNFSALVYSETFYLQIVLYSFSSVIKHRLDVLHCEEKYKQKLLNSPAAQRLKASEKIVIRAAELTATAESATTSSGSTTSTCEFSLNNSN